MMASKKYKQFLSIAAGLLVGTMTATGWAGLLFIAAVFAIILFVLYKAFSDTGERDYIIGLFVLGFLVRALMCVAAHLYNEVTGNITTYMGYSGNCIFGDSAFTSIQSQGLADIWARRVDPTIFKPFLKGSSSCRHYYIYSLFYYFFGKDEIAVKFINILFGISACVFIYLIAKEVFNRTTAKISYAVSMFFPTLMLWSITTLKETTQMLGFSVWLYALVNMRKYPTRLRFFLLLALGYFIIRAIRPEGALLVLIGGMIGFLACAPKTIFKIALLLALAAIFSILFYNYIHNIDIIFTMRLKTAHFMRSIVDWQASTYRGSGFNYKIWPEKFYQYNIDPHISTYFFNPLLVLGVILKAIALFLTVPLPWMIRSSVQAALFPVFFFWYIAIFFFVFAAVRSIISRNKASYLVLSFLLVVITPMALVSSNMGSVARYRDALVPFIFIYASYTIYLILTKLGSIKVK